MGTLMGTMGEAQAIDIETSNPDVQISWGNTVRYNAGWRMQKRDSVISSTPNSDEGDYAYDRGDMVTNRIDLLTELDVRYKTRTGFRLSATAWNDFAFHDDVRTNPALASRSSYTNNRFSSYTKRYSGGTSGEIMDAHVYNTLDLGDMPLAWKLGRQTVLWGEALSLSAHSVSYAQAPSDGYKAAANPGVDAKETALPVGQLSGTLQVMPRLSVSAQYYFEWKPSRLAEGGTYLSGTDFRLQGPDRYSRTPPAFVANRGVIKAKNSGEWGINTRWSPEWLDGTMGVYYREFSERSPTTSLNIAANTYSAIYPENAKLFGLSLSKSFGAWSVGSELVHREKTALNSTVTDGASEGARGNTTHLLLNAVTQLAPGSLWDLGTFTAEVAYSRWDKVTSGEKYFTACYKRAVGDQEAGTGCVTKEAWQGFVRFSPSWVAVWPGWDMSASASYSVGLKGNGAVLGGGNYRAGSYGLGLTFTYNTKHDFTVAYNGYLGTYESTPAGVIRVSNGAQIQDRGWLVFTYKGSF